MKALIVDDETHGRAAIRLLVDWQAHGITKVLEAEGCSRAIELVAGEAPQIVITDMRMPGHDGTELMDWLMAHAPHTKVLVVSGHDDFRFVRHAIRCGGSDYILKPVEQAELNEALSKAVAAWHAEERQRRRLTLQAIEVNQMRPHYADKLLTGLVQTPARSVNTLPRLAEELRLPQDAAVCFAAVLSFAHLDEEVLAKYRTKRELLFFTLLNICSEFLIPFGSGIAFRHLGRTDEVVILYWGEPDKLGERLNAINTGFYMALGRRMHFGIGPASPFPQGVSTSYQAARQALWRRSLVHAADYLHYAESSTEILSQALRLTEAEEKLRLIVLSGNPARIAEAAAGWIDEAVQRLPDLTAEQLRNWGRELDWMLGQWLDDRPEDTAGEDPAQADEASVVLPVDELGMLSLPVWKSSFGKRLQAAGRALAPARAHEPENHIIRDIAAYLDAHYADEITLQDISGRFYLSREYISRKFKQEFGVNLSEYLCRLRINQAKLLLLNPRLRLQQVAELVGYQDEKYFGKVFKKLEGITPGEYRKVTTGVSTADHGQTTAIYSHGGPQRRY
ncbi:response regulator [Paenibacillus sp. P96]|uniref:Response regulator n=1 Tax=Paenibacillus zeirhizosphaerae TaxID=2987519 RepID=A0ABT9FUY0_9BACL|nr:response regulator [Paenibacillus sp. P96]MDP4098542.1 response regulator [Paenibacillus sp. P96]